MVLKYINVKVFIISVSIGLFLNYITLNPPKIVHIYPTPQNFDKIQYKDSSNTCFGIKATEKICPSDPSKIASIQYQK